MNEKIVLTEGDLTTYRCSICNQFLSVPPIATISEDGTQNRCGRCEKIECGTPRRNLIFENVAKYLLFPCTYNECLEKIPWENVRTHEYICSKKTIYCPVYYKNCDELVAVSELESHFKHKHQEHLKYNNLFYDLQIGYNIVFLLLVETFQFIVYISTIENNPYVTVFSIKPLSNYTYDVKLTSKISSNTFLAYGNQKIKNYQERTCCFKCINRKCVLKFHEYSTVNTSENNKDAYTTTFKLRDVLNTLGNPDSLTFTIDILSEMQKTVIPRSNKLLRKCLMCPICQKYMQPPIHACKTGHTICSVCQPTLENCPSCKIEFGEVRLFTLEELSESLDVACHYEQIGCKWLGNVKEINEHEKVCQFKSKEE